MKVTRATVVSSLRVPLGAAQAVLPRLTSPEIAALWTIIVFVVGLITDWIDGPIARHDGKITKGADAIYDAFNLGGLSASWLQLRPSRRRLVASAVIAALYAASRPIKHRVGGRFEQHVNQAHLFGSVAMMMGVLADLGLLAGLTKRQVIAIEAAVLAFATALKRERLVEALR